MKTLIIFLFATFATLTGFSQKAKGSKVTPKSAITIQSNYSCPMHADVVSDKPGKCPKCNMDLTLSKEQMKKDVVKIYTCPMHTEVVSNNPGKCPVCNASLSLSKKEQMKMEQLKIYTCPMHGEVGANNPGKCPRCGMTLTKMKSEPALKSN